MKRIEGYEIINHGVEHSDYFQGYCTYHTEYTDVAMGIGNSEREALEDALECLAQAGWDTNTPEISADVERADDTDAVQAVIGVDEDGYPPEDYDATYVYVSIRVR